MSDGPSDDERELKSLRSTVAALEYRLGLEDEAALRAEVERLRPFEALHNDELSRMQEELDMVVEAKAFAAVGDNRRVAKLEAIKDLHQLSETRYEGERCDECGYKWPCPTLRILRPEPESPERRDSEPT